MPERQPVSQERLPKKEIHAEPKAYHNPEFSFGWYDYVLRFEQERPDDQLPEIGGKVLEVITRSKNTIIPFDHYRRLVWDSPHFSPTNLKTNISNLRRRINADPKTFNIRAIPDLGYILQDHNWATEATSISLTENGSLKYYPDTRDFAASGEIVSLTKVEAHIIQAVTRTIDLPPVRTHHLNLHGHNDRHSKRSTAVHIHKLNKKLPEGVLIKPVKNFGYQLEVDSTCK